MLTSTVVKKLGVASTALLVCDVQQRFSDVIHGFDALVSASKFLVQTAAALEVPIVVTEQYPKAFKNTVPALTTCVPASSSRVFEKTLFSMCTPEVKAHLADLGCESVVLCGLETHVCVLQTSLDLLEMGLGVYVCADAVSSQRPFDRSVALTRLQSSGAVLATAESLVFQLLRDAKHPKFKEVSVFVKEYQECAKTTPDLLTL